jgi:hypothetical protein
MQVVFMLCFVLRHVFTWIERELCQQTKHFCAVDRRGGEANLRSLVGRRLCIDSDGR